MITSISDPENHRSEKSRNSCPASMSEKPFPSPSSSPLQHCPSEGRLRLPARGPPSTTRRPTNIYKGSGVMGTCRARGPHGAAVTADENSTWPGARQEERLLTNPGSSRSLSEALLPATKGPAPPSHQSNSALLVHGSQPRPPVFSGRSSPAARRPAKEAVCRRGGKSGPRQRSPADSSQAGQPVTTMLC